MNPGYRIDVTLDAQDEVWVADVPDLPFCTAHGPTPHDAVAEVELALQAWLDAARRTGRAAPPPSPSVSRA